MDNTKDFPSYLNSYGELKDHFELHFEGLSPRERGNRFAEAVKRLVPYTPFGGRGFKQPEHTQESHDDGIDLIAHSSTNEDRLYIQSKYSIPDKSGFDAIISKFQGYYKTHYAEEAGPLFAHAGIGFEDTNVYFQIVTVHNLARIIPRYETSQYSSVEFYSQLKNNRRLEIIDGRQILDLLKALYRKANIIPSNFTLTFEADLIAKDNVYIGILSGSELKKLYTTYGDALFYENIRDFLSSRDAEFEASGSSINQEIIKTVKNEPEQFLARNNGIVIRAKEVHPLPSHKNQLSLIQASVVNGCQTTMCIVGYADPDNECFVTAKVVGTDEAWDVAHAANLQNEVTRFELEIAQFLRPQLVNKVAAHEGYRVIGRESATDLLEGIYRYEIMYEELRALFVGIFSRSPNNIFSTSYADLLPDVVAMFYKNDSEGNELLAKLFQIQQKANQSMSRLKSRMEEKSITIPSYQRFFKEDKSAYRAFFTLLAASALAEIDISKRVSEEEKIENTKLFLEKTMSAIENDLEKFERYYRFAMQAVSSIMPSEKDKKSRQQLLWQIIRAADFSGLLERINLEALNYEL